MYSVDCCPKGLVIGKQGENEAEKVVVDFSPWASEFGAGTISARLRRPKDSAAYPVALTTEGTTATWTVSATDTQYAGAGSLQLVYIVGDMVAKSVIWPVRVLPSLEEGEAPEPYESWLDTLEGLAADTQENARDAAASAADASASAEDAAQSAQSAAESAASITGLTAVAETLPEGSEASASFDSATDTLTLGIPRGDTGATGPAGPAGPKGDTGADGFSPSASVAKQDGNIVITVTDKDGTTSETLEVDDALDETSVNPVQNAAIVEAMRSMLPVDTASGAIASFPDGADGAPMLSLKAQIEPVQDLHGYDHPWPAGGGKNLLDFESWLDSCGATYTKNGDEYEITAIGTLFNQPFVFSDVDVEVTISGTLLTNGTTTNVRIDLLDTNGATVGSVYSTQQFPTTRTASKMRFNWSTAGTFKVSKVQIEKGSTATAWTPYSNICPISGHTGVNISHSGADITNPDVIPVSWESEAGTVYGGELDVVSGELTVTHGNIASYNGETLPSTWISDRDVYASGTTPTTGAQVVYELATPQTYQLTPQEVKTYLGQNNIWSDTGDTEVTYRADIQKFIEKKVTS